MSIVSELKRRGVLRVMIAYLAGAWLLMQIADLAFPAFGVADSAMAILMTVVAIGFLPVVISSWVFEWTPGGLIRDTGAEVDTPKSFDRVIMSVLALAVAVFAFDKFILDPARDQARDLEVSASARSDALVESFGDRSIAVLPFANMSSDPEQDYFSDGISEEILNLLARIKELRVISRSSSFAFRGADINIAEVAQKLNVGFVLEGSVRKSGNKLRITAQLIEGRTDRHVWSDTYDRDEGDVFEIQDDIAAMIIAQLKIEILGEAPKAFRTDPETHVLFLRAQNQAAISGRMGNEVAFELLQQVVERDPDFVPGLTRLATVTAYLPTDGPYAFLSEEQYVRIISTSIARTLELDPKNGIASAYSGWGVYLETGDIAGALPWFEKALQFEPNNSEVLRTTGAFAQSIGDNAATLRLGMRAVAIDPGCILCYYNVIDVLSDMGEFEEAESYARRRIALAPGGWSSLGQMFMAKGDAKSALEAFDNMRLEDEREWARAMALTELGRSAEFGALLDHWMESHAEDFPVRTAHMLIMQGEVDTAFDYLDEQLSGSDFGCTFKHLGRHFELMLDHPRWKARCGLDESEPAQEFHLKIPDEI